MNNVEAKAMAGVIDAMTAELLRVQVEKARLRDALAAVLDMPFPMKAWERWRKDGHPEDAAMLDRYDAVVTSARAVLSSVVPKEDAS